MPLLQSVNPARPADVIGTYDGAGPADVDAAVARATEAQRARDINAANSRRYTSITRAGCSGRRSIRRRRAVSSFGAMDLGRFVPLLDVPEEATDPIVFVVGVGTVRVHDAGDHERELDDAIFLGVLDDRPCWAIAVDDEPPAGAVPLMGLWGQVDETTFTVAGRAVQLVEWARTHR